MIPATRPALAFAVAALLLAACASSPPPAVQPSLVSLLDAAVPAKAIGAPNGVVPPRPGVKTWTWASVESCP